MKFKIWLLAALIIASFIEGSIVEGQQANIRFKNLTTKEGLSDDLAQSLLQDSQGFIWIGTRDGLDCYDGNSFTIFKHNSKIPNTLSENSVNDLFEDSHKIIWAATSGGLNKFDRNTRTFEVFRYKKNDTSGLSNNDLTKIAEDNFGNLWIGSRFGINVYQRDRNKFTHYFHNEKDSNSINGNDIYQIIKDKDGVMWINTSQGLNRFDSSTKKFIHELGSNIKKSHYTYSVGTMLDDSNHNLWYGTESTLNIIDKKVKNGIKFNQVLKNYEFNNIRDIVEDMNHNLWIGTRSGLVRYNLNDHSISKFEHQNFNNFSLTKNEIWKLLIDKQGLLWIATFKGGVSILNTNGNPIDLYRNNPDEPKSINNSFILSFLEDKDRDVWIGTDGGGLNKFDPILKTFKAYKHRPNDLSSISSNTILCIYQDQAGFIWIGTWNGGLCRFDKKTGLFKTYSSEMNSHGTLNNPNIWSILEDKNNNFWVGTMGGGLNKFDRKTGIFTNYMYDPLNPDSTYSIDNNVWVLYEDSKGKIWTGSSKGLSLFNPVTKHFKHFYQRGINSLNDGEISVNSILEDKRGRIWVGGSEGLCVLTDDHLSICSEDEGIQSCVVYGIEEDNNSNLWITTNHGVFKYDPDHKKLKIYDFTYGFQGNQYSQGAHMKNRQGQMYLGGTNGFNVFMPDSIKSYYFDSPVVITDFLVFNKSVPFINSTQQKIHVSQLNKIVLNYKQTVFSIQFASLNYINPEKNQYAYLLEGFDHDWNYVGTKHEATYTNLNPGKYIFKIRAANNEGVWNTNIKSLIIIIEPPLWKMLWFQIVVIIFILLLLIGFYYKRVTSIRRTNEMLSKLVKERTSDLEKRALEIEEKNKLLIQQAESMNETNTLLEERQQYIEEQAEELTNQKEELLIHRDELSQLNATKDKLFSILAHDLRNPFQAIIGFSQLLKSDIHKLPEDKVDKFLGLIYTSSIRGNDLLNNILQWSRAQTGRISFEPEILNLHEIAKESISLFEADASQKKIKIELLIDSNTLVFGDANMLKTIFRNLISNAIKFTFEKGKIVVNSRPLKNYTEVSVSDSGVGIPSENIDKLFRIDHTITTQGTARESGTGLGLILCKEFVDRHKGKLRVESQLNKGSTFSFTLLSSPEHE